MLFDGSGNKNWGFEAVIKQLLNKLTTNKLVLSVLAISLVAGIASVVVNVSATEPVITINKTVSKSVVKRGETFSYSITIKNAQGHHDMTNVVIKDLLPNGIVMANGATGNPRVFNIGTLPIGASRTVTLSVKAANDAPLNQPLQNLACVNTNYNPTLPICDTVNVTVQANPHLTITKSANVSTIKRGNSFTYTISVKNDGDVVLNNVLIADVLPPGITPAPGQGVTYNSATRKVTWPTLGSLAVNQTVTKTLIVQTSNSTPLGTSNNIACVTTNHNPTLPICDDANVVVKEDDDPKLKIEKDASAYEVNVNQEFTYTIKVTNTGNVKITNAHITDTLPDGVVAVDKPNDRTLSFLIVALNPGESTTRSFLAKVTDSALTNVNLKNTACIDRSDQTTGLICDDANVIVKVKTPVYTCDALTDEKLDANTYRFKVDYTAENGATLTNIAYNFGDNTPVVNTTNTSVDHDFVPGTYQTSATLTFNVNGETKVVTSNACKKQVTIADVPIFACNQLSAGTVDADQQLPFVITFNVDASATGGAVIESYLWNFGDGQTDETTADSVQHSYTQTGEFTVTVRAKTNKGTTPVSANCSLKITVTSDEPEEPVYTCDLLKVTQIADKKFKYEVSYTAKNGAVLKNFTYNFGDSKSVTTTNNPVEHTYANPGKYDASVSVTFMVDGQEKTVTSNACKKTINIVVVNQPVYTCDLLKVEHLGELKYRFTVNATAENGATVKSYMINYGDGNSDSSNSSNIFEHSYSNPGDYNAQASVVFMVNGVEKTVTSNYCKAVINTNKPDYCTVPGKEHLPVNHPDCKPDIPEEPEQPEEPETPTTTVTITPTPPSDTQSTLGTSYLPDTGAGEMIGVFMAVSMAGMMAYRIVWLRQYS
jgi:uncharacterized repeat protein (TIGR01451 family)